MKKSQSAYLNLLNEKAKSMKDPKWKYVYDFHLNQALNLFNIAKIQKKEIYYRDSVSRANKVFEGVVRLLYNLAKLLDNTVRAKRNDIYNYIDELLIKHKIPKIFGNKLDNYRDIYRNPETHEIFRDFGEKEAKITLNEAFIFLNIGLENYNLIDQNRIPINDKDYLYMIFKSFIESFSIYSEFFQLYEKRYNGIYSKNIDILLDLIQDYYKNSIFCNEFTLENHPGDKKLKPHFKITLDTLDLTFTIIKISDYDLMNNTKILEIEERIKNYMNTFNNLYFLIWSFTKRSKLTLILDLFKDLPHFHLFGLKLN